MESWPHGRKPWATTPFGPVSALHTVLLHQYWIKSPKKRKCLFLLLLTSCAKTKLKSNGNVPNISKCLDIMLPGVLMRQL